MFSTSFWGIELEINRAAENVLTLKKLYQLGVQDKTTFPWRDKNQIKSVESQQVPWRSQQHGFWEPRAYLSLKQGFSAMSSRRLMYFLLFDYIYLCTPRSALQLTNHFLLSELMPSVGEWIKMNLEYHSALKRNKLSIHETTCRNLKCTLLSKISQLEKATCYMIPNIWHSRKGKTMKI